MEFEKPADSEYSSLFVEDINSFHINIEDTEVTLLVDSGTRVVVPNPRAKEFPLHVHPHYELFYVDEGKLRVLFRDEELLLEQYDLIVIPPKVEHLSMQTDGKGHRYNIKFHIQSNGLRTDTSLFRLLHTAIFPPYVVLRNCMLLEDAIKNLHNCMLSQNKLYAGLYFLKFAAQFLSLTQNHPEQNQKKPVHLESNIMRFHTISSVINGQFKDNVTLEQIAKLLNLSVRQTNRIIQECYGVPFSELILENKMLYAANMLINSTLPVAEIARKTGYSSLKGFYHSFKKKFACLPSEYRKLHSSKKRIELEDEE